MGKEYLIGDFLKRIKRPITLSSDKEYKLVTIKMNHKGVVLRGLKKGSDIKSNMYEVKKGDFILSGIDARNGAFGIIPKELDGAIVTNDFWYFEIDENIISKRLFLELTATTWFDEICKKGSDGTTQRIRLQKNKFFNQKVILPLKEEQKLLLEKLLKLKENKAELQNEIQIQKESIIQLKQSILQEAIQGKLTQEWRKQNPDIEPASELLKRIKAEKEKRIKEKKIRKEKPLPLITQDEIPFELPDGWMWCYISELAELYTGNSINKSEKEAKYTKQQKGLIYIGTKDIEFNMRGINYNTGVIIPTKELEKFKIAPKNTVLICIEGGSSGKKIGITTQDVCFGNKLLVANTYINELSKFLYYLYNSPHFKSEFDNQRKGLRGGVSVNSFKNIKIPLPPLAEQKAIVEKIENLMQKVSAMEEEIHKSEQNAEMLMQAVLKEAFEDKKDIEV
jgi:type I restriction enzyme S subunit